MDLFKYLIYRATPEIGSGELVAGFTEKEDALKYLSYIKLMDRNGGRYYMKEYREVMGEPAAADP